MDSAVKVEGTLLRHPTPTGARPASVEELDPILASAAWKRMAAFLGVACVAYVVSYFVEQAMRTGMGATEFTNLQSHLPAKGATVLHAIVREHLDAFLQQGLLTR